MKIMKTTLLRFLSALYKNSTIENYKIEYRSKLSMPSYLNQVLIGLLLSDGSIGKSSPTSLARLSVMFGLLHASYLLHLYGIFQDFVRTPPSVSTVTDKKTGKIRYNLSFATLALPCFNELYNLFYFEND